MIATIAIVAMNESYTSRPEAVARGEDAPGLDEGGAAPAGHRNDVYIYIYIYIYRERER